MRHRTLTALAAAAAAALLALAAPATVAEAATGQVVVFSTEAQPLDVYTDPTGCQKLPPLAHVLDNLTDAPIRVYADPYCTVPATLPDGAPGTLRPNYGTHVTGIGSFRA